MSGGVGGNCRYLEVQEASSGYLEVQKASSGCLEVHEARSGYLEEAACIWRHRTAKKTSAS